MKALSSLVGTLLIMIVLQLLPAAALHAARTEKITTSGVAMAGQESSRREAVEDALRNAVEQAMGTYVTVDLLVENKQIVNEKILSQTRGYIQKYSVLDEEEKGGLYRVRIDAVVKLGKVRDDLEAAGLLMKRKQLPRLMVVITDRGANEAYLYDKQYVQSVRNIVEQEFLDRKFRLVDMQQHRLQQQLAGAGGDARRLAAIGKDAGAEIVAVVEAARYLEREVTLYGSRYKLFRSDVQLRVVETGTGRVITSGTRQTEASADLEPLYEAARDLTANAAEAVLQKWSTDVNVATQYKLNVRNVDYATLRKFEDAVRAMHGVAGLYRRAYAGGEARFDIEYRGNSDKLADRLSQLPQLNVSVTGVSQQSVDTEIRP
jgi:hypothetical protein